MRLVGAAVPRKRQREELPLSDQLLVGRLQLGLDASAKKSQISRKHLQILCQGGRWFVRRLAAIGARCQRRAATGLYHNGAVVLHGDGARSNKRGGEQD